MKRFHVLVGSFLLSLAVATTSGCVSDPLPAPPDSGATPADLAPGFCGRNTCAKMNAACGFIGDGCDAVINCGSCPSPSTCGGGSVLFHCGSGGSCVPRTCAQANATCGPIGDGCGSTIDCGRCPPGETCGVSGSNQCAVFE